MSDAPEIRRRHFLARALGALAGGAWLGRSTPRDAAAATQDESPFVGEIRMFCGDFAPVGWELCNGQLLTINGDTEALFQLIGTTYGGDGMTNFAVPDLRGRAPIHAGTNLGINYNQGEISGVETVTVLTAQIPVHNHTALASSGSADSDVPTGRIPARNAAGAPHYGGVIDTTLAANAVTSAGGTQAHNNMQPWLGINFIISIYGIFPSQT
jgi:microcystin-dependent protein